jgi:acyl-ACP thioesterase
MNLLLRLLKLLLCAPFRPKLGPLDEGRAAFRVWPTDLDLNFHMNNAAT